MNKDIKLELWSAIKDNFELFNFIQSNTFDGMFCVENSRVNNFWMDQNLLSTLGYSNISEEQMTELDLEQLVAKDDLRDIKAQSVCGAESVIVTTVNFLNNEGCALICEIKPYFIHHEKRTYTLMLILSLSDCKKSDLFVQNLLEDRNELKRLNHWFFGNFPIAFQVLDKKGRLVNVNDHWLQVMGYKREEVLGKSLSCFLIESEKEIFTKNYSKFTITEFEHNIHHTLIPKSGALIEVAYVGIVSHSQSFESGNTICYFVDFSSI